jgi:Zn-dependent protease
MDIDFAFAIIVLVVSVALHEMAHAYGARALGDATPELDGRLTANPLKHLDPMGSVVFPTISYLLGGFIIGWAKPVRYNPYNFKRFQRSGEALVAAAGPLANIVLALLAAVAFRTLGDAAARPAMIIVFVNLGLTVFNLIPIPPLDGSKILFYILGARGSAVQVFLERYGLIVALVGIMLLSDEVAAIVQVVALSLLGL